MFSRAESEAGKRQYDKKKNTTEPRPHHALGAGAQAIQVQCLTTNEVRETKQPPELLVPYLNTATFHQNAGELLPRGDRRRDRSTVSRGRRAQVDRREVVPHGQRVVAPVQEVPLAKLPPVITA